MANDVTIDPVEIIAANLIASLVKIARRWRPVTQDERSDEILSSAHRWIDHIAAMTQELDLASWPTEMLAANNRSGDPGDMIYAINYPSVSQDEESIEYDQNDRCRRAFQSLVNVGWHLYRYRQGGRTDQFGRRDVGIGQHMFVEGRGLLSAVTDAIALNLR